MIGENIKRIRKELGITLSECAQRANISKSYLSNIERNLNRNPSVLIIEKIAGVLNVDIHKLIGSEDEQNEQAITGEWLDFVNELRESGVEKEQLPEFKSVIEFARWRNEKEIEKTKSDKFVDEGKINE
ncbi:helix-turn-helix domain-containing protein [Oceanobacillus saliphilus]|uniref:helix-turn-helix domain-containing protein n=1 Tax=Oceanobacillus saliphilus TaxID=2925834 RepID=UPI00201D97FC|nr:helix-turn-helix transcriptional regulator [Oceanobacillus saliphilus]